MQDLRIIFRQHGVVSAEMLAQELQVSQPTISRYLRKLEHLVRIGAGRKALYGLAEPIESGESAWPLYLIGSDGVPEQLGTLHLLLGGHIWIDRSTPRWTVLFHDDFKDNVFPDLPWFFDDYRPQGFLGRSFARTHARELGRNPDPQSWNGRTVIEAMTRFGGDFPGAFVLGKEALKTALSSRSSILEADRSDRYPEIAERLMRGEMVGSSAGGEQPKFLIDLDSAGTRRHLLVKFTNALDNPASRRWGDLLVAEYLASQILSKHGYSAAHTRLFDAGGRRFLEVERFDRTTGEGRIPVVSVRIVAAVFLGDIGSPWPEVANQLATAGWISPNQVADLITIWTFGRLIGNTDMHLGNVSLFLGSDLPLSFTPIYDMLPMAYRPDAHGLIPEFREIETPTNTDTSSAAFLMAQEFWSAVSASHVSDSFRQIAVWHRDRLLGKRSH
jgi:hypothetical protein